MTSHLLCTDNQCGNESSSKHSIQCSGTRWAVKFSKTHLVSLSAGGQWGSPCKCCHPKRLEPSCWPSSWGEIALICHNPSLLHPRHLSWAARCSDLPGSSFRRPTPTFPLPPRWLLSATILRKFSGSRLLSFRLGAMVTFSRAHDYLKFPPQHRHLRSWLKASSTRKTSRGSKHMVLLGQAATWRHFFHFLQRTSPSPWMASFLQSPEKTSPPSMKLRGKR